MIEHIFADEYKWSVFHTSEMYVNEVIFHMLKIREKKEQESLEFFHKLKLLVFLIHGEPTEMLETIDGALKVQYKDEAYDDELGDIDKQHIRALQGGNNQ